MIDALRTPDRPLRRRARERPPRRPRRPRRARGGRAQQTFPRREIADVYMGCTNQAGEDNRNVARMASLLAGLPVEVPGVTVNRLCASGLEAVNQASRALRLGDGDLFLAGGVESMSRAPLAMPKPDRSFPRGNQTVYDTTIGWRFVNPRMEELLLDRVDGRDGRERRRALRRLARGPGRVRAREPPARRRGRRGRAASTTRSCRCRSRSRRATR